MLKKHSNTTVWRRFQPALPAISTVVLIPGSPDPRLRQDTDYIRALHQDSALTSAAIAAMEKKLKSNAGRSETGAVAPQLPCSERR